MRLHAVRLRPALPAACAAAALLASSGGGHALAAEPPRPAAGEATSAVTLLQLATAGHELTAGSLRLVTDTTSGRPVARVVVTPLVADGVAHGQQTVEPGQDRQVGPVTSAGVVPALRGVAELTGPVLEVGADAADGAASTDAAADGLGSLSVLGLPVRVDGVLRSASAVGGTAARSTKTLEVRDVALPSIADLLAALGLDLSRLPVEVLDELVRALDLTTPAVAAAGKALADARAAVEVQRVAAQAEVARQRAAVAAATQDLAVRTAALAPLQQGVLGSEAARKAAADGVASAAATLVARQQAAAASQASVDAAERALSGASSLLPGAQAAAGATLTAARAADAEADQLVAQAQAAATSAAADAAAAETAAQHTAAARDAAEAAVALAQAALDAADRLLDAALAVLDALTRALLPQVQALRDALTAVLDGTPLVALDAVDVSTGSVVTSASPGGQRAGVEGGEVRGLRVLGTDVLDDVLGSSTVDVTTLTGDRLAAVTAAVGRLTGTLSEVLSTVPGLPTLEVPAPQVELLAEEAGTGVTGGFGTATTTVTGLRVTLPPITLPVEVALPDALSLPGLSLLPRAALPTGTSALSAGDVLTSSRTSIGFGSLTEAARFRPALTGATAPGAPADAPLDGGAGDPGDDAPTATPVTLPRTGGSPGLAVLALVLVGGAVVVRRRTLAG